MPKKRGEKYGIFFFFFLLLEVEGDWGASCIFSLFVSFLNFWRRDRVMGFFLSFFVICFYFQRGEGGMRFFSSFLVTFDYLEVFCYLFTLEGGRGAWVWFPFVIIFLVFRNFFVTFFLWLKGEGGMGLFFIFYYY